MGISGTLVGESSLQNATEISSEKVKELSVDANHHILARLQADEPDRLDLYSLEISVVEQLRRIHYSVKQLAHNVTTLATESDNGLEELSAEAES